MAGPLAGIRIIDLTTMVSGPLATMTLADQGADVIKIEAPGGGDYSRHVATRRGGFSASFLNNNRNKRSVVLDLKQDAARQALDDLVTGADVFIQNFRPGVAQRMGIGEARMRANHSQLIYVSISGFGETGPYANKPVFDPLIQALSGLATVQAGSDDQRPRLVRTILPDKLTAIQTAQAICAALVGRIKSGKGQHLKINMLDTLISFLWNSDMGGHTFVGDELDVERAQSFIDLIYQCDDGFVSIAVMQDKHWAGFCHAMSVDELVDDQRFNTPARREENKDERTRLMQEIVKNRTVEQLLQLLEHRDVPCAPVLTRRQMIQHPQVQANASVMQSMHPQAGRIRQARPAAQFSDIQADDPVGAPIYGAHTLEVLREAQFDQSRIESLLASGAAVQHPSDVD